MMLHIVPGLQRCFSFRNKILMFNHDDRTNNTALLVNNAQNTTWQGQISLPELGFQKTSCSMVFLHSEVLLSYRFVSHILNLFRPYCLPITSAEGQQIEQVWIYWLPGKKGTNSLELHRSFPSVIPFLFSAQLILQLKPTSLHLKYAFLISIWLQLVKGKWEKENGQVRGLEQPDPVEGVPVHGRGSEPGEF